MATFSSGTCHLFQGDRQRGATHKDGLRIGLKVGQPVENGGVVEFFFGNGGNEPLYKIFEGLDEVFYFFYSFVNT